ncbi:hypothetical protein ACRRQX_004701 [Yersinia enterocolitica]
MLWSVALQHLVVILVVLTTRTFRFSLFISQLLAKAIPVRETNLMFISIIKWLSSRDWHAFY